jgi:hypothetical protein
MSRSGHDIHRNLRSGKNFGEVTVEFGMGQPI